MDLPLSGQGWLFLGAVSAAAFNLVGFLSVGYLGAVSAMVIGNLKTPTSILICFLIFGNPVTVQQLFGFLIGLAGVLSYDRYGKERPAVQTTDSRYRFVAKRSFSIQSDGDMEKFIAAHQDDLEFGLDDELDYLESTVSKNDPSQSVTMSEVLSNNVIGSSGQGLKP